MLEVRFKIPCLGPPRARHHLSAKWGQAQNRHAWLGSGLPQGSREALILLSASSQLEANPFSNFNNRIN